MVLRTRQLKNRYLLSTLFDLSYYNLQQWPLQLHCGDTPSISKPYPPGTRVEEPNSSNDDIPRSGTVVDIPMDPSISPQYLVQFDDGTTKSFPASKMASLIPKPRNSPFDSSHLLPPFLRLNSKITFEHEGRYHKGYLSKAPDGPYCFSYKSHINKKLPNWTVPLPSLTTNWQDLCMEGTLLPGHSLGSFLRDQSASFVSAASLLQECPRSLLCAVAPTRPDPNVWLASSGRRKTVSNRRIHTISSPWNSTVLIVHKALLGQSPRCVSSPSNPMRCCGPIAPNRAS